jgi:hypothetical protein
VSGLAFDRESRVVGVRFRIVSTSSRDGAVPGREHYVACLDCTPVERPGPLFAVISQYRRENRTSVSFFVHPSRIWDRYLT